MLEIPPAKPCKILIVNEIKIKKEKLYNIQKENNTLLKVYKNNKKVYDSFEINKGIKYFISEIKKDIHDSKEDLKKKKMN